MSSVCPAGVSGELRRGRTCATKAVAVWGVHWFICMHCSQTYLNVVLPDAAARSSPACAYYKL